MLPEYSWLSKGPFRQKDGRQRVTGAIIKTMTLYSGHSDKRCTRLRILSKRFCYVDDVLQYIAWYGVKNRYTQGVHSPGNHGNFGESLGKNRKIHEKMSKSWKNEIVLQMY